MNVPHLETPTNAMPKGLIRGWVIIAIAALLSFGLYEILPYDQNANKGLSLLLFIGILWLTEAIHITITALLVPRSRFSSVCRVWEEMVRLKQFLPLKH